jgi:hypothetical protein
VLVWTGDKVWVCKKVVAIVIAGSPAGAWKIPNAFSINYQEPKEKLELRT